MKSEACELFAATISTLRSLVSALLSEDDVIEAGILQVSGIGCRDGLKCPKLTSEVQLLSFTAFQTKHSHTPSATINPHLSLYSRSTRI